MIDIGIQLFIFLVIAFCSGLFYPVFYSIIGAPGYVPHPGVGDKFPNVTVLGVTKPSMIFRRYGAWLSNKQNEWEATHDKYRKHAALVPMFSFRGEIVTSYGRGLDITFNNEGGGLLVSFDRSEASDTTHVTTTLLPGETAKLYYFDNSNKRQVIFLSPMSLSFDRSKMPLSPYKAMGLCGTCTTFWICLSMLLSCFLIGLFPALFFFITPVAYGISMWASSLYEV